MSNNSITDLFQADPLQLTDRDLDAIIEHYRKNRLNFSLATKAAPTNTAAQKKIAAANELASKLSLSLDDFEV